MNPSKSISQKKIAEDLGVSQSLVSIVLNGRKDGIATETYKRIWDYAIERGYSPKGMRMSAMNRGQNGEIKSVGYFLRAPLRLANKSNFFSHIHEGLHDYLETHQVQTVFLGSESDFEARQVDQVEWKVPYLIGLVILGQVKPAFLSSVRRLGKPLVYVSARSPGLCHSVNSNEFQSAEQLVNHLVELGHRNFAFLGGMCARSRQEERLTGLKAALAAHDLELPDDAHVTMEDAERKHGFEMAGQLLERDLDPFPTAWVCVNGLLARGVITKLLQNGIEIGKEVSVVAFDNTRVCTEEWPEITSAAAVPEDLGREAGRILLENQGKESPRLEDVILPSKFYVRQSSGAPVEIPRSAS